MKFKKFIYIKFTLFYNENVRKIILFLILFNLIFFSSNFVFSKETGFKKIITVKENGGLIRNPNFIELTIEDENLTKDSNIILFDLKTNKEIPILILNQEDKRVRIRFELNLNKNEERQIEFRFNTQEKRSEVKKIEFTYPNFVGTEFYGISFEKIYIVGLKESDVKVLTKDGKSLFDGKVKYGQYKRIDLLSPQVFYVKSTGPIMVISSSIGEQNKNEPQDKSDDDLTYIIGSEGVIFVPRNIFISSFFDNNNIHLEDASGKLIYKGKIDKLNPLSFSFKYASLVLFKSNLPVLIQYGSFDDSPFLPIIPYKGNFIGYSFSDLTIYSPFYETNYDINLIKSKKSYKGKLNKSEIKELQTELEEVLINTQEPSYIYTYGSSSNFGGEQILSILGTPYGKEFNFITGKISTKYSTGHKRVIYVLALENDTEVNLIDITNNKNQKITLQKMSIYQYETDKTKSIISIKSNKDILVFESTNHINREIFFNISPIKDESIVINLGKTEQIGTTTPPTKPPTKPETPQIKPPKIEMPQGIFNIILWEITLIPFRFKNFINNLKIIVDIIKSVEFIKVAFPKISIKLPGFIDEFLPPFLKGLNFFLLIILIFLLILLLLLLSKKKKTIRPKPLIEEIEEIEIPQFRETKEETKLKLKEELEEVKPIEEMKPKEEFILLPKEEKEEIKEEEKLELKEEVRMEETVPFISNTEKPKELIPKDIVTEKVIDTTILKGKVVLDRKALMKIIELDLFPFLQEAYVASKAISDLPLKYRTSEKIKPVELTKFEESMAEDLGKRVGGSKETGEAIAIALRLKIDKCIVGEKFNRVFQDINIYSYERLG